MSGMTAHRIHVIGAAGVGKTTLGRSLAATLGLPHFDMDDYYHLPTDPPFQQQRSPDEFCALVERDVGPVESWVVTGGVGAWRPSPPFTAVVFLYLPPAVRLERVRKREQARYGARIEAGGDMVSAHEEFMAWAAGYDDSSAKGSNTLAIHEDILRRAACPVFRLVGPVDQEEAVRRVLEHVGKLT